MAETKTFDPPASLEIKGPGKPDPDATLPPTDEVIVQALESYRVEADNNRKSGLNPRDDQWKRNLDLYWNRYDFSGKADWQAREVMPEVPAYVDRFAAAMKEALMQSEFYTVTDPADQEGDLTQAIKRIEDYWLTRVSRGPQNQLMPYSVVFEEQMKLGAMMACASTVTWKNDVEDGRVAVESFDPQDFWVDHTGRGLYRQRRITIDKHDLKDMLKQKDNTGSPLFKVEALERMVAEMQTEQLNKRLVTGVGQEINSGRSPITLDEYIATVVDNQGNKLADRSLMVVANQKYLIRGPEKNPFTHGQDWVVYSPLVVVPLSPYGRSYMEDFGDIASTFTELTNLLLDAVRVSSMKNWVIVPSMLVNAGQVASGITPNKLWLAEDGVDPKLVLNSVDMGSLPPDALRMWQEIRRELSEAARINEIGMGQFAPKGRTTAHEVETTMRSSSALIRSVAETVEMRVLDIHLDLIWKTGLQHVKGDDPTLARVAGAPLWTEMMRRRDELIIRPFTFQARGISQLIANSQKLKGLIETLQIMASNPLLLQKFVEKVDLGRLVMMILTLNGIDITKLQTTEREALIQSIAAPLQGVAQGQTGGTGGGPASPGADALKALVGG